MALCYRHTKRRGARVLAAARARRKRWAERFSAVAVHSMADPQSSPVYRDSCFDEDQDEWTRVELRGADQSSANTPNALMNLHCCTG